VKSLHTEVGDDTPLSDDILGLQWLGHREAKATRTLPSNFSSPTGECLEELAGILLIAFENISV